LIVAGVVILLIIPFLIIFFAGAQDIHFRQLARNVKHQSAGVPFVAYLLTFIISSAIACALGYGVGYLLLKVIGELTGVLVLISMITIAIMALQHKDYPWKRINSDSDHEANLLGEKEKSFGTCIKEHLNVLGYELTLKVVFLSAIDNVYVAAGSSLLSFILLAIFATCKGQDMKTPESQRKYQVALGVLVFLQIAIAILFMIIAFITGISMFAAASADVAAAAGTADVAAAVGTAAAGTADVAAAVGTAAAGTADVAAAAGTPAAAAAAGGFGSHDSSFGGSSFGDSSFGGTSFGGSSFGGSSFGGSTGGAGFP